MRIQILPLPHNVLGDAVDRPFALIVDQYDDGPADLYTGMIDAWRQFREDCGARAILVTPETVDVAVPLIVPEG